MNPDPKSYILSDVESRAIFEKKIVPAELGVTAGGGALLCPGAAAGRYGSQRRGEEG